MESHEGPDNERLRYLLDAIATGGSRLGHVAARNSVVLLSRRPPSDIDVSEFALFEQTLARVTGLQVQITGAEYGCTRVVLTVQRSSITERTPTGHVVTDTTTVALEDANGTIPHSLLPAFLDALSRVEVASHLLKSGFTSAQSTAGGIDIGSGERQPGVDVTVYLNWPTTHVHGNVGVLADKAEVKELNHYPVPGKDEPPQLEPPLLA